MFPTQRKAWQRHGGTSLRWLSPMQEKASPSPPSTGGPAAYFFLRRSPVNRKPRPSSPNQEPSPFRTGEGGSFRLPACMRPSRRPAAKETLRRSTGTPSHAGYVLDGIQPISRGNRPSSPWQHFHPTPSPLPLPSRWNKGLPGGETGGWPRCGPTPSCPMSAPILSCFNPWGGYGEKHLLAGGAGALPENTRPCPEKVTPYPFRAREGPVATGAARNHLSVNSRRSPAVPA